MRRRVRAVGWGLMYLALVAVVAILVVGASRAHSDIALNRSGVWAGIAGTAFTALTLILTSSDKISLHDTSAIPDHVKIEAELAAKVLAEAQLARSRLVGAGEPDDQPANVRFEKSSSRFREVGGTAIGDLSSVYEYYQSLSPQRLVVLGEPGAGKTVLALELQIRLLDARRHDSGMPIPVLIWAATCDTRQRWAEWLAEHLAIRFGEAASVTKRLVRDGRILPIVDGLDEMVDPIAHLERAHVLIGELNAAMRGRERAPIVVTCRRGEYQMLGPGVERATHVEMVPLTGAEAAGYLRGQFRMAEEADRWAVILTELDTQPTGPLAAQLATPWRLTLALTVFREGGNPSALLPTGDPDEIRYGERIDSLLLDDYVPSAVRLHGRGKRYTPKQVRRWMTALADTLARQYRRGGSATDITLHSWWQPTGRRTTQKARAVIAVVPGMAWVIAGVITRDPRLIWFGAASYALACAVASSPVSVPGQLKVRQLAARYSLPAVVAGFALGLAVVIAAILKLRLTIGLTLGLGVGLAVGLGAELSDTPFVQRGRPQEARRDELWTYGLYGLAAGLSLGLTFGFTLGARDWIRHYLIVTVKAIRGRGPMRFGRFANWATRAGLLRVSGVGYQFRHRQLQAWLTSASDELRQE